MTTRQQLDRAVLRACNSDIRLVGNFQPLAELRVHAEVIAEELRVDVSRLRRCRDIADIVDLMEGSGAGRGAEDAEASEPGGLSFGF